MEYFGIKFILACFALVILVHAAQDDQSESISLDCGAKKDTNYTEKSSGINYISDVDYVETGQSFTLNNETLKNEYQQQMWTLRSFPDGTRNCYSLNLMRGDRYLITAAFLYGNYDDKNEAPEFDVYLGPNLWVTVKMEDSSSSSSWEEIIHVLASDNLDVCLVNTDSGTPFISSLEFRLMAADIYVTQIGSLQLYNRFDVGSNDSVGRKYDVYNRYWYSFMNSNSDQQINVSDSLDWKYQGDFAPALTAMRTAETPKNDTSPLTLWWTDYTSNAKYYVYFHFAELEILQANETREFTINFNDDSWRKNPFQPSYLYTNTIYSITALTSTDGNFTFDIIKTGTSTHPPILNAMEIYLVIQFPQSQTDITDIEAIKNIKVTYSLKRNWQGDPCAPQIYMWDGLNCSNLDDDPPRITSLNLSSSGLEGNIPNYISNLTSLQVLDLSNNNLTGTIPDFLANLSSLTILNLENNKFNGSVPAKLLDKQNTGSLTLSVKGNPDLCESSLCKNKKKKSILVPVVAASVATVFVLIVVVILAILWTRRRKRRTGETGSVSTVPFDSFEKKSQHFTYSDVLRITRNFEKVIGKGGFGIVYLGYLDNIQVAVKMLSQLSAQGYKQFEAEVNLLLRVHHKNLTTLVGYCFDGTNMGLIYEFMGNGNLSENLSASSNILLNWEIRLRIALEAALGLEYLHNGCKPPIIHRDVKSPNILLDDKFQAKLADFGLSRSFPVEGGTHQSTVVAGTPGYLDPEYYISSRLTEKSDVYSFGIVLMEIVTSRLVITENHSQEKLHITKYVSSLLTKGDIKSIVDPKLEGDFDVNTVWKVLELATACVSQVGSRRPSMNEIVAELSDCLETEKVRKNGPGQSQSGFDSFVSRESFASPLAR